MTRVKLIKIERQELEESYNGKKFDSLILEKKYNNVTLFDVRWYYISVDEKIINIGNNWQFNKNLESIPKLAPINKDLKDISTIVTISCRYQKETGDEFDNWEYRMVRGWFWNYLVLLKNVSGQEIIPPKKLTIGYPEKFVERELVFMDECK